MSRLKQFNTVPEGSNSFSKKFRKKYPKIGFFLDFFENSIETIMWLETDSLFFHSNVSLISRCLQETRFSFKPKMCAKEKSWIFFEK